MTEPNDYRLRWCCSELLLPALVAAEVRACRGRLDAATWQEGAPSAAAGRTS